jgi:predicted site-specific integrase-resolvase
VVYGDENTRFGFGSSETVLKAAGREMEVVNPAETDPEDLLSDLTSMVSRWCARRSGPGSAQRTTAKMVQKVEVSDAAG